jgi:hypothetical protein
MINVTAFEKRGKKRSVDHVLNSIFTGGSLDKPDELNWRVLFWDGFLTVCVKTFDSLFLPPFLLSNNNFGLESETASFHKNSDDNLHLMWKREGKIYFI